MNNLLDRRKLRFFIFYSLVCIVIFIISILFWPKNIENSKIYSLSFFTIWSILNVIIILKMALPQKTFSSTNEDHQNQSVLTFPKNEWEDIERKLTFLEKDNLDLRSSLQLEKKMLNSLLISIPFPVVVLNSNRDIIFYNKKFEEFFKLDDLKSNSNFQNYIRDHHLNEVILKTNSEQNFNYYDFNFIPLHSTQKKYFDCLIQYVENFSTTRDCKIIFFLETTDKRLTDKMREEFVANVSHEIRTPLTILMGQIQLFKNTIDQDIELQEMSKSIIHNSNRLLSMINELLELSKIEAQGNIAKDDIEIGTLVESIIFDLKDKYSSLNINAMICLDASHIYGNYILIDQLLINILENGFKYNKTNGELYVHTYYDDDQFKMVVRDTGIGIPEDQIHRIFERFFRADSSRSSNIHGTGLGLSIVKHIVQKHQGSIKVSSLINSGTTFEITLPREILTLKASK